MDAEITRLLAAGYEITFNMLDGKVDCHTINASGDGVTGFGATPAEALRKVLSVDEPRAHMCICGHHAAEHSNIESGECLAEGCGCRMLGEVIIDSEHTCMSQNPDGSGEWCYRSAGHAEKHRDANGDEWDVSLEETVEALGKRISEVAANTFSHESGRVLVETIYDAGYRDASERMLHRLDALDVRVEELEARAGRPYAATV
jgi:hypothetical protein